MVDVNCGSICSCTSDTIQTDCVLPLNVALLLNKLSSFWLLVLIYSRLSWKQRCQHEEDRQDSLREPSLRLLSPSGKNFLRPSDKRTVSNFDWRGFSQFISLMGSTHEWNQDTCIYRISCIINLVCQREYCIYWRYTWFWFSLQYLCKLILCLGWLSPHQSVKQFAPMLLVELSKCNITLAQNLPMSLCLSSVDFF